MECENANVEILICVSDLSWDDVASVDYDVLAIPKHRIEYFKYKQIKVWDKSHSLVLHSEFLLHYLPDSRLTYLT